jgi:hypothetical protein
MFWLHCLGLEEEFQKLIWTRGCHGHIKYWKTNNFHSKNLPFLIDPYISNILIHYVRLWQGFWGVGKGEAGEAAGDRC